MDRFVEDFGPGRAGTGGLDREQTEEEMGDASGGEGEAGYVSPTEGSTDPEAQPTYEAEIAAERTGTTAGEETGGTTGSGAPWASGEGVGTDLARDKDPTER